MGDYFQLQETVLIAILWHFIENRGQGQKKFKSMFRYNSPIWIY